MVRGPVPLEYDSSMSRLELSLFADYFQFYLQDAAALPAEISFAEAWTEEAIDRQLAAMPRALGVGTSRNMTVPVVVEIGTAPPDDDPAAELVTEASFEVASNQLVVMGCTDYAPDAARVEVVPGRHRARVFYYDQESVRDDGLEGDDRYRVVVWPDPEPVPPRILADRRLLRPSQRAR